MKETSLHVAFGAGLILAIGAVATRVDSTIRATAKANKVITETISDTTNTLMSVSKVANTALGDTVALRHDIRAMQAQIDALKSKIGG